MGRSKLGKVVVIGQGYVGLPLSMCAVEAGWEVVGFDTAASRVRALRGAESPIEDVSNARLAEALQSRRYLPSGDAGHLNGFDIAVICVPTPLRDGVPELSHVRAASTTIARHMRVGCTIVLESTSYPGTTEEVVRPLLEASGLTAGETFHLGYSPERIDPANPSWHLQNTPKIVSGLTARCLEHVRAFYDSILDETVSVSELKQAEMAKLVENTFRQVNIALVNELATLASDLGIDFNETLEAAATKPFGYMRFTPGPGVGGQCLPVDPVILHWYSRQRLGRSVRFVELANEINDHMPSRVIQRLSQMAESLGLPLREAKILVLGLAYKKNIGDVRESPSMRVTEELVQIGAQIRCLDPHVSPANLPSGCVSVPATEAPTEALKADIVLLLVDHDAFDLHEIIKAAKCVLDCRYVVMGPHVQHL